MRILLPALGLAIAAFGQTPGDQRISYSVEKKSVQYVVADLAKAVGLGYDFNKSAAQTDPERRRWVNNLSIENEPFDAAMQKVLEPVGLRYEIEGKVVVLYRAAGAATQPSPDQRISYSVDRKSVQYVVADLAKAVGLGYDFNKSAAQTDPERRRWVDNLSIENEPFDAAMRKVLGPVGLRYEVEGKLVVLYRAAGAVKQPSPDQRISYSVDRKSVQYVVIDLATAVGLGYNWDKSAAQTDPERRRWVDNLKIKDQPFDVAMQKVLKPVGLRYEIEGNQVVLYRR